MLAAPAARHAELARAVALARAAPGMRLADVPAGGGYLRPLLPGVEVVAVELARAFGDDGVVRADDLVAIPLPDGAVDRVVCLAAAHHVADEAALYHELARLTRPGGRVVVADVARASAEARFLDGFVDRHTALGHVGRFLDAGSRARLEAAGVVIDHDEHARVDWRFASRPALAAFCRDLFGLDGVDDAALLVALSDALGVRDDGDHVALSWSLRYLAGDVQG